MKTIYPIFNVLGILVIVPTMMAFEWAKSALTHKSPVSATSEATQ